MPGLNRSWRRGAGRTGGRLVLGILIPLALALGWELAIRSGLAQGRLLPPPSRVLGTLLALAQSGDLRLHVQATLLRVALGFVAGAGAGILVGALTGTLPLARHLLDPSLQALRAVPSLAWVPLFILWLGILETPKVVLIAVGVFFPVYVGVSGAIASVDRKLVEVGRIFRLSRLALARRILLPAVLPGTLVALRTGLGLGFLFVVAAELMGASEGLGYLLVDGQQFGKPDQILAAILAFALLGKLADGLLVLATRPLLRWQDVSRGVL
ncbi:MULTISPECIES: ABC transporter permease [unclassified Methylobacterium]|jgi:sulfonate transport system permease protein|uniref:ABC transporter permease n=1 Tax=unclassified Methylobacterium TaxID=2615210 RepID=UPI0006FAE9A2|nr:MULTISPECIES: ABC transporter permease [unclassified Methylobacterium]KQP77530.1 ABC transporter permease [Methylobacterium sp. Leaf117]MBY0256986.1 ABC transporter permease [Methylobacterium sp.]MCJ2081518.1 ABC transporter permease [Methylobacterium sp. J-090]